MASVINTNMASLVAQRNLSKSQDALTQSVQRLSSGLRINSAKDDAAGLGISQNLTSQINTVNQGVRNANDAISMLQTAEGASGEVSNMMQRMKELATQAANDSLNSDDRGYIGKELGALRDEIDKVAERTTFNGRSLLTGDVDGAGGSTAEFQIGASTSDTIQVDAFADLKMTGGGNSEMSDVGDAIDAFMADTSVANAQALSDSLDTSIKFVADKRTTIGAYQNRLSHAIDNLSTQSENLQGARSRVMDTDYAAETASLTKTQVMQQAATAMLGQANQMPNAIMKLLG